jgi:hypothetical protein
MMHKDQTYIKRSCSSIGIIPSKLQSGCYTCTRNKWGNWHEFWFYVAEGIVEDHPGLPVAEMCSHYYSAYPQFEVAEEDANEWALWCAAGLSSGRDLVEEFVAYGVWPLAHG